MDVDTLLKPHTSADASDVTVAAPPKRKGVKERMQEVIKKIVDNVPVT